MAKTSPSQASRGRGDDHRWSWGRFGRHFQLGETREAVLSGFTLRGGYTNSFGGGGIAILSSSPTIRDNVIKDNQVCNSGGGISSFWGSPLIEHNTITHNGMRGCSGGWGLGIYIYGNSAAEIVGNLITENNDTAHRSVSGGGVALFSAGNPTVRGNVISNNVIVPPVVGVVARGGAIADRQRHARNHRRQPDCRQ